MTTKSRVERVRETAKKHYLLAKERGDIQYLVRGPVEYVRKVQAYAKALKEELK